MAERRNPTNAVRSTTYGAVHQSLIWNYGRAPICIWDENHTGRMEWANTSGVYSRDLQDYLPMCVSCHRSFDYSEKQRQLTIARLKAHRIAIRYKVAQYKDGKLVAIHECLKDAARSVGMSHSTIHEHMAKKTKQAGGFQWEKVF